MLQKLVGPRKRRTGIKIQFTVIYYDGCAMPAQRGGVGRSGRPTPSPAGPSAPSRVGRLVVAAALGAGRLAAPRRSGTAPGLGVRLRDLLVQIPRCVGLVAFPYPR